MAADISKTVRFTEPQWKRWARLIGKRYCNTWADVVTAALEAMEADLVKQGELTRYTPEGLVSKNVPDLFTMDSAPAPIADPSPATAAEPDTTVHGTGVCVQCGKGKRGAVPLNKIGLCAGCELVRHSGGKITTGDKLPPVEVGKKKQAPRPKPQPVPTAARTTGKDKQPAAHAKDKGKDKKPAAARTTSKKGGA